MRWVALTALAIAGLYACGDGGSPQPVVDSQTHWMQPCVTTAECGPLVCSCGFCSEPCDDAAACSAHDGAVCAMGCGEASLCLPACGEPGECAEFGDFLTCADGRCIPDDQVPEPDAGPDADPGDSDVPEVPEPCTLEPTPRPLVDAVTPDSPPAIATGSATSAWVDGTLGRAHIAVSSGDSAWRGTQPLGVVPRVAAAQVGGRVAVAWIEDATRVVFDSLDTATGLWSGHRQLRSVEEGTVGDVLLRATPDGWAVAWAYEREECCPQVFRSVEMQRLDLTGDVVADAVTLVAGDPLASDPAWTDHGEGFALVWIEEGAVRLRLFDDAGTPEADADTVSGDGAVAAEPSVASRGDEIVVAWGDRRGNPERPEVYLAKAGEAEAQVTVDAKDTRWPHVLTTQTGYALSWMDQLPARVPAGVSVAPVGLDLSVGTVEQVATMDAAGGQLSVTWDGEAVVAGFASVGPAGQGDGVVRPRVVLASDGGVVIAPQAVLTGPGVVVSSPAIAAGTNGAVAWLDTRTGGVDPFFAVFDADGQQTLPELLIGEPGGVADSVDVAVAGADVFGVVTSEDGGVSFHLAGPLGLGGPSVSVADAGAALAVHPVIASGPDRFGMAWVDAQGLVQFREFSTGGQPLGGTQVAFDGAAPQIHLSFDDGFVVAWSSDEASTRWPVGEAVETGPAGAAAVGLEGGLLVVGESAVTLALPGGTSELPAVVGELVAAYREAEDWIVHGTRASIRVSRGALSLEGLWDGDAPADIALGPQGPVSIDLGDSSLNTSTVERVCP